MKPPVIPGSEPSKNAFPDFVLSENVAKLIAILTTFSRTGHNWADVDCAGNMDVPALMRTGHYQLDGTFTDWQSRL
jgi:hypothetical protein